MGVSVLLIGKSGSGKSTSLRGFNEKELALVNVIGKKLPFRKEFENTIETDDYRTIAEWIFKTPQKSIVIDDAGYLIVNMFMNGHSSAGNGNAVFGFYNKVGDSFWNLIEYVKKLDKDKIVYFVMHEDKSENGDIKPKTIGKILDEKVCLEGLFTIVLRSAKEDKKYVFRTQSNGFDVSKSPLGLFDNEIIDNDLKYVDSKIRDYYGLNTNKKGEKSE